MEGQNVVNAIQASGTTSRPVRNVSQVENFINNARNLFNQVVKFGEDFSRLTAPLPGFGQELPSGNNDTISNIRIYEQTTGSYVNFAVTPEVSETKGTLYTEVSEIRKAASILVYIGSPSRTFSINASLVSRTEEEAAENFIKLSLLKSWAMPDANNAGVGAGALNVGSPSVLYLYGYGKVFKRIQMIMKNITVSYPHDTDYISTGDGKTKMPIILSVNLSFQEIRSGDELDKFDIEKYKVGLLEDW